MLSEREWFWLPQLSSLRSQWQLGRRARIALCSRPRTGVARSRCSSEVGLGRRTYSRSMPTAEWWHPAKEMEWCRRSRCALEDVGSRSSSSSAPRRPVRRFELVIREERTLRLLRRQRLRARDVGVIQCLDPSGEQLVVFTSGGPDTPTGRLVRMTPTTSWTSGRERRTTRP